MKYLKMLGIAASLALAAMALVGATSALAKTIHLETCEKGTILCLVTSVGSIILAHSGSVIVSNAFLNNLCLGEIEAEVLSMLSSDPTTKIDAHIIAARLSKCTSFEVNSLNLPWLLLVLLELYAASKTGLVEGGVLVDLLKTPVGTCSYSETSKDMPNFTWKNGSPTTVTLSGSLEREAGSNALCGLGSLSGEFKITQVHDKMWSELHGDILLPTNLIINELA